MYEPLNSAVLTTLTLEGVKYIIRRYIVKNIYFDFSPLFYKLMLSFLTFVWSIILSYAGLADPIAFTLKALVEWAISILVALALYQLSIKPMKEYIKYF